MPHTIEEVTNLLRGLRPGEVQEVEQGYVVKISGMSITISKHEIEEYLAIKPKVLRPQETTFAFPGHFEQVIEFQGKGPATWRFFREAEAFIIKHDTSGFQLEISPISSVFILSLADSDAIHKDLRRSIILRRPVNRDKETLSLRDVFYRIFSVKVNPPTGHQFFNNTKQLRAIAESGLYHVAFGYGMGITSVTSWDRQLYYLETRRRESVQFPLRTYNQELVAYYQLALGADSLILSYLAFYKILEYFFTSASENLLHEKMKDILIAPDFAHTKTGKLRDLAKTIRRFDQKMDERKMLNTVLDQYIDRDTIRTWISEFESNNGNHFTDEKEIFGETIKIDLSENQLFPTIGARIYHVRNALVHNKEGEISRFIPFSGQEKILYHETPLLQRIIEELIQKTGKDIQY
jgi:hypothetical protein